ncbi:unnamed protein product [Prorocentrum cordatum]|uniref:Uncharacterized protein n=1 Tax=Prorocentrum cordatum TaxID=2364126 RepID=A0ABN9W1Y2_9DINO|nr:unnamed protein product [Polarella glacialis]
MAEPAGARVLDALRGGEAIPREAEVAPGTLCAPMGTTTSTGRRSAPTRGASRKARYHYRNRHDEVLTNVFQMLGYVGKFVPCGNFEQPFANHFFKQYDVDWKEVA